jgi:hypothetical protein
MVSRVVELSCGGRLRILRTGEGCILHFDVIELASFDEGGKCVTLTISETGLLRDSLDDVLNLPCGKCRGPN